MDAKKFGSFIAVLRREKGMTQADLGAILQVTDKAVSRWERGLGFPDINTIEPLANALEVSVMELMRSEKIQEPETAREASEAIVNTFALVRQHRCRERRVLLRIFFLALAALGAVLLLDSLPLWAQGMYLAFVFLPLLCFFSGGAMLFYSLMRRRNRQPCGQSVLAGCLLLLFPIGMALFFVIAGAAGLGPVPS